MAFKNPMRMDVILSNKRMVIFTGTVDVNVASDGDLLKQPWTFTVPSSLGLTPKIVQKVLAVAAPSAFNVGDTDAIIAVNETDAEAFATASDSGIAVTLWTAVQNGQLYSVAYQVTALVDEDA